MKDKRSAQSASELAIFGAILMFVIGMIVHSGLGASHAMNAQLKALRYALSESKKTAAGAYDDCTPVRGSKACTSRNTASIVIIEDRLSVSAGEKLGTRDRIPFMASGSATFSRNLFYNIDWGEDNNLPVADVIVNGQRFPFTTSAFTEITLDDSLPPCSTNPRGGLCWDDECLQTGSGYAGCAIMYKIVGNYNNSEDWDPDCDVCFDLDFNGIPDVPVEDREEFNWQWAKVRGVTGEVSEKSILDVDGDLKEETVFGVSAKGNGVITSLKVKDDQAGDYDTTWDDRDDILRRAQGLSVLKAPGLTDDIQMFSFTRDGTLLRIEEGKLYNTVDGQFVRETFRQEHVDVIQRGFRLSRDTGRFCKNGVPPQKTGGMDNPVEICCDDESVCRYPAAKGLPPIKGGCFVEKVVELTCMDTPALVIYIRSRIEDLRGRRWITRIDPQN